MVGRELGTRRVKYDSDAAILYALSVGAPPDDLQLVYERDLKVLPTFGLTLGLWTADAAGAAGAFLPQHALHGAQDLVVAGELPPAADFDVTGVIAAVYDTGRSALIDVVAEAEFFTATYSIILPGQGGFGGQKPTVAADVTGADAHRAESVQTTDVGQAALYRLTGDHHAIHIDPVAARAAGFERPILHGLCTLGIAARQVAHQVQTPPHTLSRLHARFAAPVLPGQSLVTTTRYESGVAGSGIVADFSSEVAGVRVLGAGQASFATP